MRAIATTAFGLSLAFAATAQARTDRTQQPGTVEYYIMHTAERQAMDRQCAVSAGWSAQCQAAQKADQVHPDCAGAAAGPGRSDGRW